MEITNTTSDENRPDWLAGGNPQAIEQQEARGQRELVASQQLPIEINPAEGKAILEAAGVVFGDPCEGDELFCKATLPQGWEKRAGNHSMWSELVDAEGKRRAGIFYKAAFYDRKAVMMVEMPSS